MKTRMTALLAGVALAGLMGTALPASAEDEIFVPLFTYRTGPFAGSGVPIADGMKDYLTMLNERDGGIGGVKLKIEECETGYDTKKGVECYESVKGRSPVMINPWSTGITLQLIPKASVDKIPVLSMAYGLSASARGGVFPWVFNPPDTYWLLGRIWRLLARKRFVFDHHDLNPEVYEARFGRRGLLHRGLLARVAPAGELVELTGGLGRAPPDQVRAGWRLPRLSRHEEATPSLAIGPYAGGRVLEFGLS